MCLCSSTKQCDKHHFRALPGKIQSLGPRSDFTLLVKSLLDTLGWVHSPTGAFHTTLWKMRCSGLLQQGEWPKECLACFILS